MRSTQNRDCGRRGYARSRSSGLHLVPVFTRATSSIVPNTASLVLSRPYRRRHAKRRMHYTRASCLLTHPHLCELDCSQGGPSVNRLRTRKELTGPPAKAAAACPRGCEGAGADPRVAPAASAGAVAGVATTGPASRSPCCHSCPPASTTCRTSTLAAWAGLPATAPGDPSCEGRRTGTAWTAAAARTASGPVAAVTPPAQSSEASMEMCCGLHLEDYSVFIVSYQSVACEGRKIVRYEGEGSKSTYAFLNLQILPNFSHWTHRG